MIIDTHTHAWPDKVSRKARSNLEGLFNIKMAAEPTVESLLFFMEKNRIDVSVICGVATKPEQVSGINDWLFGIRDNRFKVFCALHPDYSDWEKELLRIKKSGDGIKLQPEFQNFYIDEERLFPIYFEIEKLGLPLLFHCGEELSGTMLVRSSPSRVARVKKEFPKLKLIAAHFGGFKLWHETVEHLIGKDIYMDTAYFLHFLPKEKVKEMLLNHRSDRLLFGTDFPLCDQAGDIDFINSLDIPDSLKEKIFYKNASELLGI